MAGLKSSGISDAGPSTLTSLDDFNIYLSEGKIDSTRRQTEDPSLDKAPQFRTSISKIWLWEILAYCFSFTCMSAIIAVLAFEDGKQIDQWGM